MEFRLVSNDFLTDLHSLTGHIECKIQEKKSDGTLQNLARGNLIGTIPSSIISNCIKNFRLFLYDRQLSPERSDRYSLISYLSIMKYIFVMFLQTVTLIYLLSSFLGILYFLVILRIISL